MAKFIMEKQRLVFLAAVIVLGRENLSVPGRLPVLVNLFLEQHPEGVALARIGVEIQVVPENLRQAHRDFRGFAGLLDGVEE